MTALFAIAQIWAQPRCPSEDEWIKKVWYTYTMEFIYPERRMKICHLLENDGTGDHDAK
jgi:hypothetical protein